MGAFALMAYEPMKSSTLMAVVYSVTFAAIAFWLLLERRACAQIHLENQALFERLNETTEKLAKNQRSPSRAAPAFAGVSGSGARVGDAPGDSEVEIHRLRFDLAGLLHLHQEAELLREDTRQTWLALEERKKADRDARRAANGASSQLEIIKAEYWTEHKRMDVTDELQDRIQGDVLRALAGNNLKGDPEYGQAKYLTIEYRFGGIAKTNKFREGQVIRIPEP